MAPTAFELAKRFESSIVALKASVVMGPTPGTVIKRRQDLVCAREFFKYVVGPAFLLPHHVICTTA